MREEISAFIVRQIEAKPSISTDDLQQQIGRIVCSKDGDHLCGPCDKPPYVFAFAWGPKAQKRFFVVAYELFVGGMGGGLTTIESYVWNRDVNQATRTARAGRELDRRIVNFQLLSMAADEAWIIASGPMQSWSGRAFPGRAVIYHVTSTASSVIWDKDAPNLTVQRNPLGWEATYEDGERFYSGQPQPHVYDVYSFDELHKFRRVIHYRY